MLFLTDECFLICGVVFPSRKMLKEPLNAKNFRAVLMKNHWVVKRFPPPLSTCSSLMRVLCLITKYNTVSYLAELEVLYYSLGFKKTLTNKPKTHIKPPT